MSYTKKAVRGGSLVLLMMVLHSFLAYSLRIALARNLTVAEYGLFYAVLTFILFFLSLRDGALGYSLTKFIAEYQAKDDYSKVKTFIFSAFIYQLAFSLIFAAAVYVLAPYLALHYFRADEASTMLLLFIIFIFVSVFYGYPTAVLTGFQDIKWYPLAKPLKLATTLVSILAFLALGYGILAPVLGYIVGTVLASAIFSIGLLKYGFILKHKVKNFFGTSKQLFAFGIPVIFAGFGSTIIGFADTLILTYLTTLETVGIYNVVLPTATIFLFMGTGISAVILPLIAELKGKNENAKITQGIRLIYRYAIFATVPLIFSVFVFSEAFITLLFGIDYVSGILAYRILLFGILCYTVAIINNNAISALGKPGIVTKIIFISAFVNVLMNLMLIPFFGITGAAIATTVSYFYVFVASTRRLSMMVGLASPWRNWIKTGLLGLVFVGIIYLIKTLVDLNIWVEIALSTTVAGIVYLVLSKKLRIINVSELKVLIKRAF